MTRTKRLLILGLVALLTGIAVNFWVTPFGLGSILVVPGGILAGGMAYRMYLDAIERNNHGMSRPPGDRGDTQ